MQTTTELICLPSTGMDPRFLSGFLKKRIGPLFYLEGRGCGYFFACKCIVIITMKVLENIPGPLIDPSSHAGSATVIFPATGVVKGGGMGWTAHSLSIDMLSWEFVWNVSTNDYNDVMTSVHCTLVKVRYVAIKPKSLKQFIGGNLWTCSPVVVLLTSKFDKVDKLEQNKRNFWALAGLLYNARRYRKHCLKLLFIKVNKLLK